MTYRIYALIIGSLLMCGVLLAAVLVPSDLTKGNRANAPASGPPQDAPEITGMVWVPGGEFLMGTSSTPDPQNSDRIKPDELPAHTVELDGYWMDEHEVTNREFAEFVAMTGFVTFAEKTPTPEELARSGMDVSAFHGKDLKPGSLCFNCEFDRSNLAVTFDKENHPQGPQNWEYAVWKIVDGADWRHPDGPGSSIENRMDHPVVHVNWEDAVAYCQWAGKRLPTEAEFEFAARSGGRSDKFPWGEEREPGGKYMCNYWQGVFPTERLTRDGFETTAPVKSYPPNALGLYDMGGNVWEWCHDLYHAEYYSISPRSNPQGPDESFDPGEPGIIKRVQRGGSFMCNVNSCTGYRTRARMRGEFTSSSFHNGFRCALSTTDIDAYLAARAKIETWRKTSAK